MEKFLLATSAQWQEAEKKLKATLELEGQKINSLRNQLDVSRNLAEEHRVEIIDLEKRLSENVLTYSERLKQLGDLFAQERNLGKEALSAAEDKIVSLHNEANLLIAQNKGWERERKVFLDQIAAFEDKFIALEERCLSYEEQIAKSASAPCPHCDQPVKLILLEKGSNKCPKCSGDIFCE
jgi:chromosome segregation ATPase